MKPVHGRLAACAIAALLTAGAACPAAAQELKPWRHGILEAKSDAGFIMMVDKGGFAAKHGLKIETMQMKSGATVIKALIAGELDSVDMGVAEAIVAGAHGADVRIVGCTWPGLPQVILAKADIKTPQDLKGRTIAISAPGSLPDVLARAVLDKYKIADSEVNFANLGSDLDRYKSLAVGVSDAAVVSNEFEPIAPENIKVLVRGHEALPQFVRLCVTTSGKTISQRRDDLAQFVAAEMDAYQFAATHRAEAVKLTREIAGAKADDPRPEFIYDQAIKDKQIDPKLAIPIDNLSWMQDQFIKAGILQKPIDMHKLAAEDIYQQALGLAGK
jgi:NitT/TauT family transport system substrate-binding protein